MKSLVIYDSNFGNTKIIAEVISKGFGENAICISVNEFSPKYLEGVKLIIVGSPIIGWQPTERMMAFLNYFNPNELKEIKAATFDTRVKLFIHGDAAKKIALKLKELGAEMIAEPQPFYVKGKEGPLFDGEVEKATDWVKTLIDKCNN
ncbi:MAG: flavodoxin domain-containing protein [Bacteroidia bacterium]|nr:flavodoxin domain-containing protein [Bacteroidia bacterium]